MNVRWVLVASAIVGAVAALAVLAPRSSYQPGPLLKAHQQLITDCNACHRPWRGPSNAGCVNCHGELSENNPHTGLDVTDKDAGLMPGHTLAMDTAHNLECLSCHGEHQGPTPNIGMSAGFACTWCHKHPAIPAVPEHQVHVMERQFFVRHLFRRPFSHYEHELLTKSHYPPVAGGFNCSSCHLVTPVPPGRNDQMSFKWAGCAGTGCHLVPQDRFMQLSPSLGPSPVSIPYSSVVTVRHIKAVFVHSAGHLKTACERCHFEMNKSRDPDDQASLAVSRCFDCHTHRPDSGGDQIATGPINSRQDQSTDPQTAARKARAVRPARGVPLNAGAKVLACSQCHLFHAYGVVPIRDFPNPAPQFPPNRPDHLKLTVYVPRWRSIDGNSRIRAVTLDGVVLSPWWMGMVAIGLVTYQFTRYVRHLSQTHNFHEAAPDVAPQRPREVPALDDTYQTSIRNLYIVGEAAGTASINLAMRSGRQVIEAIASQLRPYPSSSQPDLYDVVIVGCGPAGLGATATAKVLGLKYATLEKLTPASTLRSYPRAKFVQATPIDLAEYGSFFLEGDNSREELIREWEKIIAKLQLVINDREEVTAVMREQNHLLVRTARGNSYRARAVVLAIGVRGNPRHLNLPGEEPGRVFYNLIEPEEFTGCRILVVGGGNAGAEAVRALADRRLANTVSYCFRSPVLTNVTPENADAIVALQKAKAISIYPATILTEIRPQSVVLEPLKPASGGVSAGAIELANDYIFAMIGAELPVAFLKSIGIKMVSKGRLYR